MSYIAEVHNVFIASPNDVIIERKVVREVIHEWNIINSSSRGVVLLPLGWETHSVPDMGKSAQEIINEQVLKKADLLVGVFWSKVGTPTKNYPSGSIEEIREHIDAGKPAMIYFSKRPLPQESDPRQWREVKRFKEYCKKVGLYCEYDSIEEFEKLFRNHLSIKSSDCNNITDTTPTFELNEEDIDDILSNLYNAKKYLLLFIDAVNHDGQNEVNEISAKLTKTFRMIYVYKELNTYNLPNSHKEFLDMLVDNYNDLVSKMQAIMPLLGTNKNTSEFEEAERNINLQRQKLLNIYNTRIHLFQD